MIYCSQCWYFKSPKQTRNYPKRVAPIWKLRPHIRTQLRQRLVLWNKAKPMLLTYQGSRFKVLLFVTYSIIQSIYIYIYIYIYLLYREETKQPLHPITDLTVPWVLSSAGKLIRYLHGSYFLPYRNTCSTPDVSGAALHNTIELIIINDAVCTGCRVAWQISDSKLLSRSIYDVLTQISNDFQWSLLRPV